MQPVRHELRGGRRLKGVLEGHHVIIVIVVVAVARGSDSRCSL